jgi:hypothetical protein
MHLAICLADGTKISRPEYNTIHKSAETIYNNLMDLIGLDPRLAMDNDDPKLPTRTVFKSLLLRVDGTFCSTGARSGQWLLRLFCARRLSQLVHSR